MKKRKKITTVVVKMKINGKIKILALTITKTTNVAVNKFIEDGYFKVETEFVNRSPDFTKIQNKNTI